MTRKDHAFCGDMDCEICTGRCYEGWQGHIFRNGLKRPCDCGKFKNIKESDQLSSASDSVLKNSI